MLFRDLEIIFYVLKNNFFYTRLGFYYAHGDIDAFFLLLFQ